MRFKGIICLTKVTKNRTHTERNESTIIFNDSKIEIIDENKLFLDIKDREVFYVASSVSEKCKDNQGKTYFNVLVNWVKCVEDGENEIVLPEGVTDILIITQEIFDNLINKGFEKDEIYSVFKEKGLGQVASELPEVVDFSALTAQIVDC